MLPVLDVIYSNGRMVNTSFVEKLFFVIIP